MEKHTETRGNPPKLLWVDCKAHSVKGHSKKVTKAAGPSWRRRVPAWLEVAPQKAGRLEKVNEQTGTNAEQKIKTTKNSKENKAGGLIKQMSVSLRK